jgi:putative membrane protein
MPQPNGQPTETPPDAPPPQSLNEGTSGNALAAPGVAAATPKPTLSDGQIAMISDLANSAEVEQGKLAQSKAKSAAVKKFAAMMVKHHGEAKTEQNKLVKRLGITPTQSPDATTLKGDADKTLATLREASGPSFDAAYMDSQVAEHQKVLDTIDQQLLPSAQSAEVRDALQKAREKVVSHLEEAKRLQNELAKQPK